MRCSLIVILFFLIHNLFGQLNIVSWNIRDFGQSRNDIEIEQIAAIIKHADIVAIQEVVAKHPGGAQAVGRLIDVLDRSGSDWDYEISHPTKSTSSYKTERYAFLWKKNKASVMAGGAYLANELSEQVEREPYVAKFKIGNDYVHIINYHACTHTEKFPEREEIKAISKWIIQAEFENTIWVGDMNLEREDIAFNIIREVGFNSALQGEKTSLKRSCENGDYLSRAEDNILYKFDTLGFLKSMVIDFIANGPCDEVEWKWISYSDHLPINILIQSK